MNPLGYHNIQKSYVGHYLVSTMAMNGRGFRTIILARCDEADVYLTSIAEDNTTVYSAINCHHAFILTIVNRKQMEKFNQ